MHPQRSIAVIYLARGAGDDCIGRIERFVRSYEQFPAGIDHSLYVVYKGFSGGAELARARTVFSAVEHRALETEDRSLDVGAYLDAAREIRDEQVCFFNTNSEVVCSAWLAKLSVNLNQPRVGLVGATGSFETLCDLDSVFPAFPNVHVRSNAFMLDRELFCSAFAGAVIRDKMDTYLVESGPDSLTQRVLSYDLNVLIVGRNGRGYPPRWWPTSDTFRQGAQTNLLIADNQTRNFAVASWNEKRRIVQRTWGPYRQGNAVLRIEDSETSNEHRGSAVPGTIHPLVGSRSRFQKSLGAVNSNGLLWSARIKEGCSMRKSEDRRTTDR